MAKTLRVTLADDLHAELAAIADAQGIDMGELIKRSVALTRWVWEHRDALVFADIDGEVAELVFFGGAGSTSDGAAHDHHWPDSSTTFHHTHSRGDRPTATANSSGARHRARSQRLGSVRPGHNRLTGSG